MIETLHLTKRFDRFTAVDDLSITVRPGEILGFLGPNGAGKSTTVKMLTGMISATEGSASVAGLDIATESLEMKKRIGYIPESGALYETLTPVEYLDFVSSLHHIDPDIALNRFTELLDLFDISEAADQQMSELSKGMKQKVLIISALIHGPDVLFLDEPLSGLDANAAMVVKELLKKFAAQGRTIFFCSHILEVVERICTRIIIIDKGREIINGTAEEIIAKTGTRTLEEAFSRLTGVRDAHELSTDVLEALERV